MEQMGIPVKMIHAGHANMFLSSIFRDTLAGVTGLQSNFMTRMLKEEGLVEVIR